MELYKLYVCYSPCNRNFFHTSVKHGENLIAIECSAVFMEQHISNIRVCIFKISNEYITLSVTISNTLISNTF